MDPRDGVLGVYVVTYQVTAETVGDVDSDDVTAGGPEPPSQLKTKK